MPTGKAKDVAETMLKASAQFSGKHKLDEAARDRFLTLCDLTEIIADEFGAEEIQFRIKPEDQCGEIFFETDEFIFENGRSHPFFEYIKAADFLNISKAKSGMLKVRFGVKDLWVVR